MALIGTVGLDDCINNSDLSRIAVVGNGVQPIVYPGQGRFGGMAIAPASTESSGQFRLPMQWPVSGNCGFAAYVRLTTIDGVLIKNINSAANKSGIVIRILTSQVQVCDAQTPSNIVAFVNTTAFSDFNYHWFEYCRVGSVFQVYVDDVLLLEVPTTSAAALGQIWIANIGTAPRWDDFIVWDDTGTDFNTFPIHPQRVSYLQPNAAGDSAEWDIAGGAATNHEAVTKSTYTGGNTQWVETISDGVKDLYNFSDLSYEPYKVNAVQVKVFAQDSGSETSQLEIIMKTGGTESVIGLVDLPVAVNYVLSAITHRDAAGVPWTFGSINAAQFGIQA